MLASRQLPSGARAAGRASARPNRQASAVRCSANVQRSEAVASPVQESASTRPVQDTAGSASRRDWLVKSSAALLAAATFGQTHAAQAEEAVAPAPTAASSAGPVRYEDNVDKFELNIPGNWIQAEGSITAEGQFQGAGAGSTRRTVAFFPPNRKPGEVNLSVTVTNVSFEFTKLGSFGNVATFAGNLVNSLDRSYLLRAPAWVKKPDEPVQVAKLVDYKESNDQYFVEYTVQKLPEPQRHLLSKLTLGSDGRYNRLYTLTAQCREEDLPQYRAVFQTALDSFRAEVKPLV